MTKDVFPMRVLMAVPQYPYPVVGGLERQAHELAKALLGLEVEVQVLSGKVELNQPASESVEGVLVYRIPWSHKRWRRFIRTPYYLLRFLYTRKHTYDVVHLHQFSWFGLVIILISRLLSKPVLTKLPNVGEFGLPGLLVSPVGRLKLAIFRLTDAVAAISKESLGELKSIGFPSCRVLFTHNGIRIATNVQRLNCSRRIHSSGLSRVVFVGRLSEEKGIPDLLDVWYRIISASRTAVKLELWGTGPLERILKQQCNRLGLDDSVVFRGYVGDIRRKLGDMDIFVLPSRAEGNSNAILEAMAAGLPIISTRVGGTPMLVGAEGAHLLFDPGDKEGLYCRLLHLIDDQELRGKVGRAMQHRVLSHFDIREVAGTYLSAYHLLAAGKCDKICAIGGFSNLN